MPIKHGYADTRIYRIWYNMKARCYNPKNTKYHLYGGRGIKICNEWLQSFVVFQKWAEQNGYNDSLSIDRIDSNGNYTPTNCRWATNKEQRANVRPYHCKFKNNERFNVTEAAIKAGIEPSIVFLRLHKLK